LELSKGILSSKGKTKHNSRAPVPNIAYTVGNGAVAETTIKQVLGAPNGLDPMC
jgi:hypothetical protein